MTWKGAGTEACANDGIAAAVRGGGRDSPGAAETQVSSWRSGVPTDEDSFRDLFCARVHAAWQLACKLAPPTALALVTQRTGRSCIVARRSVSVIIIEHWLRLLSTTLQTRAMFRPARMWCRWLPPCACCVPSQPRRGSAGATALLANLEQCARPPAPSLPPPSPPPSPPPLWPPALASALVVAALSCGLLLRLDLEFPRACVQGRGARQRGEG